MVFTAIASMIVTLILAISWHTYRRCFYASPKHRASPYDPMEGEQYRAVEETIFRVIGIMERYSYQDVAVTAYDGTPLRGRYYHFRDSAPLLILCHGYRSSALRDCCGGHALAQKLQFNVLVIHQRCHGESDGQTITFGIRERRDVHSWIAWANNRFGADTPILLFGLSMGAATVLMGLEQGYPPNVACVMADSPYAAPADIISKVCRDMGYPPRLCLPFIRLGAILFGHFRLDTCSAAEAVRKANVPVLLIHGEEDRLVPSSMSAVIRDACGAPCRLYTFPRAGHGLSCMIDPQRYESIIIDFLNKIPSIRPFLPDEIKNS